VVVCNTNAVVFANGDLSEKALNRANIQDESLVVCVDGGLRHAQAYGIQPHLLIGDFDSAQSSQLDAAELTDVPRITHPPNKDASDLELALHELERRQVKKVSLLGVSGGRTDHYLFNWMVPTAKNWTFDLRLIDNTSDAFVVNHSKPFNASLPVGAVLSLLPLQAVTGVTTTNLQYPLSGASINPGSTLGLSNVVKGPEVSVEVSRGVLLVIINH